MRSLSRSQGLAGGLTGMTNVGVLDDARSPFIRVSDAARLLGVSRSFAYDMANRWIATNGSEGLPAVRLERRVLIKRAALERWTD